MCPVKFGPFEFDPSRRELRKFGLRVRVPDQSLKILALLVEDPGETVSRQKLRDVLWPLGTCVEYEQSINAAVKRLRLALGDRAEKAVYIDRVPRVGYRFVAPVEPLSVANGQSARPLGESQARRRFLAALSVLTGGALVWTRWKLYAPRARNAVVLLESVQDSTPDKALQGAFRQALLLQMGNSSALRVISEERVQSILKLMGKESTVPIRGKVASEICERAGGKISIGGSIGGIGNSYFLELKASDCVTNEPIVSVYEEAATLNQIPDAIRRAAVGIRRGLGESLDGEIREGHLPEVTTPNLAALRAYSIAVSEKASGGDPIPFLKGAMALDPSFAAPCAVLANVYYWQGLELEAESAISKAFDLRTNVSGLERLMIEAAYHKIVTQDADQAIVLSRLLRDRYPDEVAYWRAGLISLCMLGETGAALAWAADEVERAPDDAVSYFDHAVMLASTGRITEAECALQNAEMRGIRSELYLFVKYVDAVLRDDRPLLASLERQLDEAPSIPTLSNLRVHTAGYLGQREKAREIAARRARSGPGSATPLRASVALNEVLLGDRQGGLEEAKAALEMSRGRRTLAPCGFALALSGNHALAHAILGELLDRYPSDTVLRSAWAPGIRAAIAYSKGHFLQALQESSGLPYIGRYRWPAYVRGISFLALNRAPEAALEFRNLLARKAEMLTGSFVYGAAVLWPVSAVGLARALTMQGDHNRAVAELRGLLHVLREADPALPLLLEARNELTEQTNQRISGKARVHEPSVHSRS